MGVAVVRMPEKKPQPTLKSPADANAKIKKVAGVTIPAGMWNPPPPGRPLQPKDYRAPRPYQEFEAHFSEAWPEEAYLKGANYWGRSVRANPPAPEGHPSFGNPAHYGHHGWEIDAVRNEEDVHDKYMDDLHHDRACSDGLLPSEFAPAGEPHTHGRPMSSPLRAPPRGPNHRAVKAAYGRFGQDYDVHGYQVESTGHLEHGGDMSWNSLHDEMRQERRRTAWNFNPDHDPTKHRHQHGHKGLAKSVMKERDSGASPVTMSVYNTMGRGIK